MKTEELRDRLQKIEKITNEEWLRSLDERKRKELEFHDQDRDPSRRSEQDIYEKFYGNRKYYGAVGPSTQYLDQWIRENAPHKVFLDYACGNGKNAVKAAKAGAALAVGFDISPMAVRLSKQRAAEEGVGDKTFFFQADAENTQLPDHSVDIIVCSGMLHHLDLSYAFPELRRILALNGKILVIEALACNPFIKLYRELTPQMRTSWEKAHILGMKDVTFAGRFFDVGNMKFWHIAGILYPYMKPLLPVLTWIDKFLTAIPGIQLMAWMFTFEMRQREKK